jgi:hypothetical protein
MDNRSEAPRPILRRVALTVSLAGIAVVAILLISMRGSEPMVPTEAGSETVPEIKADLSDDLIDGIPPIDANAPGDTKTATFAMG